MVDEHGSLAVQECHEGLSRLLLRGGKNRRKFFAIAVKDERRNVSALHVFLVGDVLVLVGGVDVDGEEQNARVLLAQFVDETGYPLALLGPGVEKRSDHQAIGRFLDG